MVIDEPSRSRPVRTAGAPRPRTPRTRAPRSTRCSPGCGPATPPIRARAAPAAGAPPRHRSAPEHRRPRRRRREPSRSRARRPRLEPPPRPTERRAGAAVRLAAATPGGRGRPRRSPRTTCSAPSAAEILDPLAKDLGPPRRSARCRTSRTSCWTRSARSRARSSATDVLPVAEEQESRRGRRCSTEPLSAAYAQRRTRALAGRGAAPSPGAARSCSTSWRTAMVEPWRQRLVSAIDGAGDDPEAITQRLGARYREYRGRELEDALGDALAAAWARGAFAAVPDGTLLRWVPAEVGRCPDCDDNALEPTARGAAVPDRAALPARAPGLSLLPRAGRTGAPRPDEPGPKPPLPLPAEHGCPLGSPSMRVPPVERRRRGGFRIRGWMIAIVVVLVVLFLSARARRLLHRLPLVRLRRVRLRRGAACSGPGSRRRRSSPSSSSC